MTQRVKPKMFGTAGIRGRTNVDITPLLAMRMSLVYADSLGNAGEVALGRDTRPGSDMLARAAAAGLQSGGLTVTDCGVIPTGGLATWVREKGLDGAILITGSHTPPDRNGFIVMTDTGGYIPDDEAVALERSYAAIAQRSETVASDRIGSCVPAEDPLGIYQKALLRAGNTKAIADRKLRVLFDPCNGAACAAFPPLLSALGIDAVPSNADARPIPARPTEPRAENLVAVAAKSFASKCDFGVATDIDADRILFIDDRGRVLSEDLVGCIFARDLLKKGSVWVTPINSSNLLDEVAASIGARLEFCRAGQPATVERILELKADYACEESGKYYFVKDAAWCDGLLATVKMADLLARTGKRLSELADSFPKYVQVKEQVACPDAKKETAMEKIRALWEREGLEGRASDLTIDGLKRNYADHSWLLLRKSGTEPVIRVFADAPTEARARELTTLGKNIVSRAL